MGFPPRADFYLGLSAGQYRGGGTSPVMYGKAGIYYGLSNPASGAAAVLMEGYGGLREDISDGGIRVMMAVPAFRIAFGADHNFRDNRTDFIMSHFEALAGLIDFLLIAGLCDWVDTREDLERLLPAYSGTKRTVARRVKHAS